MKAFLAASAACAIIFAAQATAQTPPPPPTLPVAPTVASSAPKVGPSADVKRQARRAPPPAVRRVAAANRAATQEPAAQGFINAAQVYAYIEGAIYQVYAAPGAVTDIALQPGEGLIAVASGDTARWVIGDTTSGSGADKRTHVLVKPFAAGLTTNLVITTDRRSYHLQLASNARTAMTALSWTYPADALIALRRAAEDAEAAKPIAAGLSIDQLRFDYEVSGDRPTWRPVRAFDDGCQTFIEFPASLAVGDAPPLFLVGPKGEAELVNYRVRGRFYVVDRIFEVAELRLGTKKQQIVRIARVGITRGRRG